MIKICYIDVETTGLDPKKNAMIQISGQIDLDGEPEEKFNYYIQPFRDDRVDQKALEVTGYKLDSDPRFLPPQEIYADFIRVLDSYVDKYDPSDKFFFCGYNCNNFDAGFVREWFKKNGNKFFGSYFFWPTLDVMILAGQKLRNVRHQMRKFTLLDVAKALNIEVDESRLHDALYDIELTRAVYLEVIK